MKRLQATFLVCVLALLYACQVNDDAVTRALARRIIPDHESLFVFEREADSIDYFELSSRGKKVVIKGNNSNSLAVGLNYYLKTYCLTSVSWEACNPVEMPAFLPAVDTPIRVVARAKERFFLNYCTFGYTMPWWGWPEWERFIDWMALRGVTMPLAITGQEAIWQKVWQKIGLSNDEICRFFTGPAHLPWHRMSNIDYWQGPLPQEWIDNQLLLQKKILKRERELDMRPVLPAFAGHVPQEIKRIYPDASITRVSYWGGFADEYRCSFLNPADSLFAYIQREFLEEQTRQFGTNNIYGVDPFNEIDAPSWDSRTLTQMSSGLYKSISAVDPDAIWLQMGWLFYADPKHWTPENIEAFLRAVPQDRMIMLDYFCEYTEIWKQTEKFYGQPYLWCYLGNFGGNTMLSGNFKTVGDRLNDAFANGGDNLVGLGSTLEGFGVNEFMYDYVLDKAWLIDCPDDEWVDRLADRRVGFKSEQARRAWHILCDKIYVNPAQTGQATLTSAHPSLEGNWHWTTKPATGYDIKELYEVWTMLLTVDSNRDSYRFDLVNIGRQLLGDYFLILRDRFTAAYNQRNVALMQTVGAQMNDLLVDLDRLVACHPEFSLERWIDAARRFGADEVAKAYYETNARTLISVWGDSYHLTDYASRTWSGLVSSYYGERWSMFVQSAIEAVRLGRQFDQKSFDQKIRTFECEWANASCPIKYPKAGDALLVARELAVKYQQEFVRDNY